MKKKATIVIWAGIIVIVGVILFLTQRQFRYWLTGEPAAVQNNTRAEQLTLPTGEQSGIDTFLSDPGYGRKKLSYEEQLFLYKNNVLQFNESCELATRDRSFHLGNEVMIDNRSKESRTIHVGTITTMVEPYSFSFITLRDKGAISVGCDDKNIVATLSVEQ